ncbi:HdeD family acid-resistance protein [Actinomadura sp. 9N407]|uniref:HdeD family acid-resistance protein n=1 Tax=Actinomadura sp. 9N407 TaxID=3375154 RepID=UPI0037A7AEA2
MSSARTPHAAGRVPPPANGMLLMRLAEGAWGIALAVGTLSTLLGFALVAWPKATIGVVAVLFGLKLIAHGVYRIAQAVVTDEAPSTRALFTVLGVLSFAIGVLALRNLLQTVTVLALLFGLFWLISGVIELVAVLADGSTPERGWSAALAGLSILFGLVVLVYPGMTLTALTWLLGLWLITWGLLTVALTLWVRHAGRQQARLSR